MVKLIKFFLNSLFSELKEKLIDHIWKLCICVNVIEFCEINDKIMKSNNVNLVLSQKNPGLNL